MSHIYRIETLQDMLMIPIESRDEFFEQLGTALALHELAFSDGAVTQPIGALIWTDDGDNSVALQDKDGTPWLTLEITK